MTAISRRVALAAGAAFAAVPVVRAATAAIGGVERFAPELDALIVPGTAVEKLGDGIQWAEGPVWARDGGYLLFSDPPGNVMRKWTRDGGVVEFLRPSGLVGDASAMREAGSNGLIVGRDGALLMADSGNRAIARVDLATKQKTILVDRFEGKRFNSPNDLVQAKDGAIYFTDPPYGLKDDIHSPMKEVPFSGVYRLSPDGKLALLEKSLNFPNGIALSPDERILIVSNSDPQRPVILRYALGSDGMPTGSSLFFDAAPLMKSNAPGLPDGMKIDVHGNLFASGPGGIFVFTPDAKLLGLIEIPGKPIANCAFGEDGSTLFLTASDTLACIRTRTKGIGFA
jgi:gluconolactonase